MQALEKAIEWAGGHTALADKLGISYTNISVWKRRGSVAYKHRIRIEELTKGKIKATDFND